MADSIAEYTVRDFSAVDRQIEQIAERERIITRKLKLANIRKGVILAAAALIAIGLFLVLVAWAYRIAFPPEQEIVETTKIIEKIVQPPKIVIQTPEGSQINRPSETANISRSSSPPFNIRNLIAEDSRQAAKEIDQRLNVAGVNTNDADVSASLSWNNYNDLDLIMQEPNGNVISFRKKRSTTHGVLDVDANAGKITRSPVENIQWPIGKAPKGKYIVRVMFYKKESTEPANGFTTFDVKLSYNGENRVLSGTFPNNIPAQTKTTVATIKVD